MSEEKIEWLPWAQESFRRAKDENKPVLLSLVARWCYPCAIMDSTSYVDPEVVRLVREHYVPVRVDADERPDINLRYNLGGWPTTAFLTPEGDIMAGATLIDPQQMRPMLERLHATFTTRRGEIDSAIRDREARIRRTEEAVAYVQRAKLGDEALRKTLRGVLATFDSANGGFGREPKFPMPESLGVLLHALAETGGADFLQVISLSIDAVVDKELCDKVDGGFFRYAASANWTGVQTEKLTEDNAALARVLVDFSLLTGLGKYRECGVRTLEFLRGTMFDPETGLFGVARDADQAWYSLEPDQRKERPGPKVDRRPFPASSAAAASAFLRAACALGRPEWTDVARKCLDALEPRPGLLRDHVFVARALLDAYETTGRAEYRDRAGKILGPLTETFGAKEGGLRDRTAAEGDVGELAKEKRDITENALAAEQLLRYSAISGVHRHRGEGEGVLCSFPDYLDDYGHYTAVYAVVMDRAVRPATEIDIVAPEDSDASALAAAALKPVLVRRVVRWHRDEKELAAAKERGLEVEGGPAVYISRKDRKAGPARKPEEVPACLDQILSRP